jgi:hypothetical protein
VVKLGCRSVIMLKKKYSKQEVGKSAKSCRTKFHHRNKQIVLDDVSRISELWF